MPAGFIPNEGLAPTLEELLGKTAPSLLPWQLIFWVNDLEPDFDVVLADLVEATWDGYTRLTLSRDLWTTPTVADGCAHSTFTEEATQWFVLGGPTETNYGYAYIDTGAGVIRFIQRFDDDDITPVVVGGKVVLLPEYTFTSHECT